MEILDPEAHLVPQALPLCLKHKDHQVSLDTPDCQGEKDRRCVCQREKELVHVCVCVYKPHKFIRFSTDPKPFSLFTGKQR